MAGSWLHTVLLCDCSEGDSPARSRHREFCLPGAPGQQPLPGHTWRCCCPGEALQPHGCGASFQGSLAACGLSCSWSRSTVADSCSRVLPPHSSAPQPSLIREAGTSPAAKLNHLACVFGHARPLMEKCCGISSASITHLS